MHDPMQAESLNENTITILSDLLSGTSLVASRDHIEISIKSVSDKLGSPSAA